MTAQNTRNRLPCMARARSTMSGATDLNHCTAETTTGKNPNRNAEMTLGRMPKPNQTKDSGQGKLDDHDTLTHIREGRALDPVAADCKI